MKIKLTLLIFLLIVISANAQIYTPNGAIQGASANNSVGIGIVTPIGKLDIAVGSTGTFNPVNQTDGSISIGNSGISTFAPHITGKSTNSTGLSLYGLTSDSNTNPDITFGIRTIANADYTTLTSSAFRFSRFGTVLLDIKRNGNVGIGAADATSLLSVGNNHGIKLSVGNSNWLKTAVIQTGYENGIEDFTELKVPSFANNLAYMRIIRNGNVGIGVNNPANKLDVNGTIHSKEVKVDMTGWSDFVFKKGYDLPTLEKVEKHIKEKGHLENIPNEEEVLKNGINLGEMNIKLLQKIEELTLYAIEQENKNDKQSKEIEKLKKENEAFKSVFERLSKLEQKIK